VAISEEGDLALASDLVHAPFGGTLANRRADTLPLMTSRHALLLITIGCVLLIAGGALRAKPVSSCASDCINEAEPYLNASVLVQPALLSGPNFKIVPEVQVRGYMANFLIDTPYGPLRAESVELLGVRIAEIPAIEALDRASRIGAFAHALAERGRKTAAAVGNVAAHPVDAVTGLPAGVARYLRTQLDTWSGRAQSLADCSARKFENSGDPFRAPAGPMTAGRDVAEDDGHPSADNKKERSWYARAGSETEREARRYLKYNEQRRAMAKWLGVDPNTSNPILNDKLDSLAWAAVGGNFSAGTALGEVAGTAADVISYSGKLNQYVLEKPPEQLREENRRKLAKFCSDDDSIRSFLRRGGFNDTLRTELAESLEKLQPRSGCNDLIELAATTRGEVEARYLSNALMVIRRNAPESAGGDLVVAGAALAWRTPQGKLMLPLPVDYLTWSGDLADFFDQATFAVTDKTVLIGGEASIAAQRQLTDRGWNLRVRAPSDGAPAYAQNDFAPVARGSVPAARGGLTEAN